MASGIGGIAFDIVRGELAGLKERSVLWSVVGINGIGVQLTGAGDRTPSKVDCIHFDTLANLKTKQANIEALQGAAVTFENDKGVTSGIGLITGISQPEIRPAQGYQIANAYRMSLQVTLIAIA